MSPKIIKMHPEYDLQIFETTDDLNKAAASFIVDIANKAVNSTGRFSLVLSGGHTPEQLYELLALSPYNQQMPWAETFFFWGDERCVPLENERNNAKMAQLALFSKIEIPPSNIHRIPVNLPPDRAAIAYEKLIKDFFSEEAPRFDLILLGLGDNGHTASLFPGTAVLQEKSRGIRKVYVEEQNEFRITMTAPLINMALNILFLVTGENKASVLNTILKGSYQPNLYPAQIVKPQSKKLYWFADREAAALLK